MNKFKFRYYKQKILIIPSNSYFIRIILIQVNRDLLEFYIPNNV